jgi:2'-5' RNA ligase
MRTFVAIRCGAPIRARLAREASRLAALDRGVRPTREEDLHLTVQFLGETREDVVPALGEALRRAAARFPPIPVRYRGLGAFPSAGRPQMLWVGLEEEGEPGRLAALAAAVGESLTPLGHPPERRPWTAHVTLGRFRGGRPRPALSEAIERGRALDLGRETLSDLELILSAPREGRYHYIDLTTVRLGS